MADILASVSVVLGAEISGFRAAMAEARKELKGLVQFSEGLKDIGTSLSTYVSAPLALLGTAAVAASAKIESLQKGLQAIAVQELGKQGITGLAGIQQAAVATTDRMKELEAVARSPGLGFEQAVRGDVRLRAVGISAEQSAKSIKAFGNAIATTGGGASEFDRVTVQLAQLSAKGKVLAQDLRPIIEAAPAVSGALQRLYGTVDSETISASLAKQGQSSTDFIRVLTDELAKLPQVTGGLKNSFENLADTTTLGLAKIGDGISKALDIPGITEKISNAITGLSDSFANLSPGVQKAVVIFGAVVAATGPVLLAIGSIGVALPAITAGFSTLGISSLAALGPILPVVAAVAAAAILVYENWDRVGPLFTSLGNTLGGVGERLSNTFSGLGDALGKTTGSTSFFADVARDTGKALTDVLVLPLRVLVGALDVVVGSCLAVGGALKGVFTGDFREAASGAAQALDGLKLALFNIQKEVPSTGAQFREFFKDLLLAKQGVDYFSDALDDAGKHLGLLGALEAQLKEAKDARPALTSEVDIKASNLLIEGLEKEIKRLNELGLATKGAQSALAKLREELRVNGDQSLLLGNQYDFMGERQKILTQGVKNLLEKGYAPGSAVVRGFAEELGRLNTILGDNTHLAAGAIDGLAKLATIKPEKEKINPLTGLEIPEIKLPTRLNILPVDESVLLRSLETAVAYISDTYKRLSLGQQQALLAATSFNDQFSTIIEGGLQRLATGIGSALGQALASTESLGPALGRALLSTVGSIATQLGELAIGVGIGVLGINVALKSLNPYVAIAAGIALVALGAFASSKASSIGGGGGGGSTSSGFSAPSSYNQPKAPQQTIKVLAEFKIRGEDLYAVGRQGAYRLQRTS